MIKKTIKFLDLYAQYLTIKPDIDAAIQRVIETAAFIGGKEITEFEAAFAKCHNANHCVSVANGTDALEIAIEALNLPQDSEIIVPANTFIASSEAVTRQGHSVVFADANPQNYTLSIDSVQSKITPKTKAIIAVHLYGHPCDMDALLALAKAHQLEIIEDCAQAHLAQYKGQKVGTFGTVSTFSFYPGKNLGAYGDGGAILTQNSELATRCRMIANHGRLEKYNHLFEGRNSRLDGLQAAILSAKLPHLPLWTERRRSIADQYNAGLANIPFITLPLASGSVKAVYHLYVLRTPHRDALATFLNENNIQTGVHYPISLLKLPAYLHHNLSSAAFFANTADTQILSLPIGEHLNDDDIHYVIDKIQDFFKNK